ncbi:MAG: TonB family protein [Alphaproteobacteria bacterium]|nr:TonB family protein [Alphaproteobacteria bacterium]
MVHAVSATYLRFERMSPSAVALAMLLHGAVVVAWWWASPLDARDHLEDAIEVTVESPTPQPAPQMAAAQAPPPAAPTPPPPTTPTPPRPTAQPRLGLPPIGGSPEATKPPQTQPPTPAQPQPPPPPEPQQALAPPPPTPTPEPPPTLDKLLPPIATPPAPLTSRDIPKPAPPPPPSPPPKPRPAPQQPAQQQPQQQQQQALKPSPLRQTPPGAPTTGPSPAPSVTFQNPAEAYRVNRVKDEYLWRVAQKISQYHYAAQNQREQGALVVRLVIARDGRLVDAGISRSSGVPALDKGAVETMRAASPYSPLPAEIAGAAVEFILPLNFAYRQ